MLSLKNFTYVLSLADHFFLLARSDGSVRLIDTHNTAAPQKTFGGCENRSVRSVALDPSAQLLAAACTDGHLVVWRCGDSSSSTIAPSHTSRILPLTLTSQQSAATIEGGAATLAFRCAFEPTHGALLAVPGETGAQLLRAQNDFSVLRTLTSQASVSTPTPTLGTTSLDCVAAPDLWVAPRAMRNLDLCTHPSCIIFPSFQPSPGRPTVLSWRAPHSLVTFTFFTRHRC